MVSVSRFASNVGCVKTLFKSTETIGKHVWTEMFTSMLLLYLLHSTLHI